MAQIVYLNGDYLPAAEARVSPLDRGFVFADGVYEVIPVYGRRLFRLAEHLQRLGNSLSGIRMSSPHTPEQWREILTELIRRNEGEDQSVYLQVTRGVAPRDHAFPAGGTPTVFAMSSPLAPLPAEIAVRGVAAITVEDIRWRYCHLKTIALLPNILLRQQAIDAGAVEAILVRDGQVTEGAASNIFVVRDDNTLLTPPKGSLLLPGITRDLIMELAAANGIAHGERRIAAGDLAQAREIWLTSSTKEILPVTNLDGRPVGDGAPGPLWSRMRTLYQRYKQAFAAAGAEP